MRKPWNISSVTDLDKQILILIARGYNAKQIGSMVYRSFNTINGRILDMRLVAGAMNITSLVTFAIHKGIITIEDIYPEATVIQMVRPPAEYNNKQYL